MAEDISRRGFLAGLTASGTALALEARHRTAVPAPPARAHGSLPDRRSRVSANR